MTVPVRGEMFQRLIEHLRRAQEDAAILAHLHRDDHKTGKAMAMGWLAVSEALKKMQHNVTQLATKGRLH